MTLNPTTTLARIKARGPCQRGWETGLRALGPDLHAPISLGDVASSNDSADALWCIRALDWTDVAVRRAVIGGAVLPAAKRAATQTTDRRVSDAIAAIEHWCAGDSVDLSAAIAAADAAYAASAASAAAYAAAVAGDAAYAAYSAAAVADAADAAARAAAPAYAADAAERKQQRRDIIAAFPPIRLKEIAS